MSQKHLCCLVKSGKLVFVANFFHNLDYVAYKLLLINHTACIEPKYSAKSMQPPLLRMRLDQAFALL